MTDQKSRGLEVVKLCRNKPLTDAQRSNITALLKDGADLCVRYGPGNTALHFAAEKGHIDVVKELLVRGADPTSSNDEGKTPSDFARATGNSEVSKLLEAAASKKKLQYSVPLQSPSSSKASLAAAADAESNAEASSEAALPDPKHVGHACDAETERQVLSSAEREAFENTITKTVSSPLPPGVTSIG
jgi:hypothetical protein